MRSFTYHGGSAVILVQVYKGHCLTHYLSLYYMVVLQTFPKAWVLK